VRFFVWQSTLQAVAMYPLVRKSFPVIFSQVNVINTRLPFIGSSWFQTRNSSNEKANDDLFNLHSKSKVTTTDKWIIYHYGLSAVKGKYKSYKEIPDYVSNSIIDRSKARFRIRVNIFLIFLVISAALKNIIAGKKIKEGFVRTKSGKSCCKKEGWNRCFASIPKLTVNNLLSRDHFNNT